MFVPKGESFPVYTKILTRAVKNQGYDFKNHLQIRTLS